MDLTHKMLKAMEVGDVIECGKLLPGLDDEPIVWELNEKTPTCYHFDMYWSGVLVGAISAVVDKGLIKVVE